MTYSGDPEETKWRNAAAEREAKNDAQEAKAADEAKPDPNPTKT